MLPPLRSLQAFEAVARHSSFTAAALELNVTQSAISHQIRNLESLLGSRLIIRRGKDIRLARDGQMLFQDLTEAFDLIKRSTAALAAARAASPLGVSLRPHFASKWLAPRLAAFWQQHPGFDLRFIHTNDPADFSNPSLHVSIEWCRVGAVPPGAQLLVEGNLTPACSPQTLASLSGAMSPERLVEHALLYEADDHSWEEWLEQAGIPGLAPRHREFYEDTNVRQQAAIENAGFALACPELIADDIAAGRLVCPFEIFLPSYSYYLVMPQDRRAIPNVRKFTQWLFASSSRATR